MTNTTTLSKSVQTKSILPLIALTLTSTFSTHSRAQSVDYILDTGVGSFNIGPSQFDANMTWVNGFNTQLGGEIINSVSISFGDIEDNDGNTGSDQLTIAILNDPNNDMNPYDAELISTTSATWIDTGFGEFIEYPINPTQVEGVFFVAVMMDVIQRANPASMDPNAPVLGAQSWMFYNPEPNLEDLGNSPFKLHMIESPFNGAWMIRAHAKNETVCIADFTDDGELNFFDVSAFLNAFNSNDLIADLTNDGVFNFFDISTFLSSFTAGCP